MPVFLSLGKQGFGVESRAGAEIPPTVAALNELFRISSDRYSEANNYRRNRKDLPRQQDAD